MKYDRYEIKNVKHVKSMSDDSTCFSLDLFVDGKKFANVSNRGQGGCHDTRFYAPFKMDDEKRVTDEMKADKFLVDSNTEEFDSAVDTLFSMWIAAKEITSFCKTKALYIKENDIFSTGYKGKTAPDQRLFDHVKSQYPDAIILNTMDISEASKLYVSVERAKVDAEFDTAPTGPQL